MISHDVRAQVTDLLVRYGGALDSGDLDAWVECFAEQCTYRIITRENADRGLEAGIMYCEGRAMLRDRVQYIRKAAIYNIHRDRHVISQPAIAQIAPGLFRTTTSFALFQSEPDRDSRLFCVGVYQDDIVADAGGYRFRSKEVLLDNDSIMPLLSSPV